MISLKDLKQQLDLEVLVESTKTEIDVSITDVNRPGMQLVGFYEYFAYERPQVIGKVEMTYLESLEPDVRRERLRTYFSYDLPCVVICRGMTAPPELLEAALRVYQGRAFYDGTGELERSDLEPLCRKYGLIVL